MRSNDEGGEISLDGLATAITTGAVRLAAATATWLRLVAEFDRRGGWHGVGILSCAHWLAWQCGLGSVAAREHVRVARALGGLPRIEAAFAAGRLSYSKARALTRVAAPDCEAALLEFALSATAAQTELFCRQWRRADDAASGDAAAAGNAARRTEDEQSFTHRYDDDGYLTIRLRMPGVEGAALMARIEARAERDARRERAQSKKAAAGHAATRAAGGHVDRELEERCAEDAAVGRARERTAVRRITALGDLVEAGAAVERRRPGDPPRREVVVHVDAAVLADDTAAGRAHVEGGPAISGAQARRVLCEATVVAMIERGREPLAVGRRRRRATKAQWRALLRRDGGCARPGCPERRVERLHAHHMRHWLFGGPTDVDNLVLLCDVDHGLVHEHDLVMSRSHGRLLVTAPDGSRVWGRADAAFVAGLDGSSPDQGDAVGAVGAVAAGVTAGAEADAGVDLHARRPGGRPPRRRSRRRPHSSMPGRPPARPGDVSPGGRRVRHPGDRGSGSGRASRFSVAEASERLDRVLFPGGAPPRPRPGDVPYERLDLDWALLVLMGNRNLVRRLEHERRSAG